MLVCRDVLLLDWLGLRDGGRDRAASATNQLLGLGRVVPNVLLCGLGGTGSMVACELLHLLGLLVDDVGGILEVVVDELLVSLVDERRQEENGGRDERHAPEWHNLDQVVGEESCNAGLELSAKCAEKEAGSLQQKKQGRSQQRECVETR